jgi:hypothetical protein
MNYKLDFDVNSIEVNVPNQHLKLNEGEIVPRLVTNFDKQISKTSSPIKLNQSDHSKSAKSPYRGKQQPVDDLDVSESQKLLINEYTLLADPFQIVTGKPVLLDKRVGSSRGTRSNPINNNPINNNHINNPVNNKIIINNNTTTTTNNNNGNNNNNNNNNNSNNSNNNNNNNLPISMEKGNKISIINNSLNDIVTFNTHEDTFAKISIEQNQLQLVNEEKNNNNNNNNNRVNFESILDNKFDSPSYIEHEHQTRGDINVAKYSSKIATAHEKEYGRENLRPTTYLRENIHNATRSNTNSRVRSKSPLRRSQPVAEAFPPTSPKIDNQILVSKPIHNRAQVLATRNYDLSNNDIRTNEIIDTNVKRKEYIPTTKKITEESSNSQSTVKSVTMINFTQIHTNKATVKSKLKSNKLPSTNNTKPEVEIDKNTSHTHNHIGFPSCNEIKLTSRPPSSTKRRPSSSSAVRNRATSRQSNRPTTGVELETIQVETTPTKSNGYGTLKVNDTIITSPKSKIVHKIRSLSAKPRSRNSLRTNSSVALELEQESSIFTNNIKHKSSSNLITNENSLYIAAGNDVITKNNNNNNNGNNNNNNNNNNGLLDVSIYEGLSNSTAVDPDITGWSWLSGGQNQYLTDATNLINNYTSKIVQTVSTKNNSNQNIIKKKVQHENNGYPPSLINKSLQDKKKLLENKMNKRTQEMNNLLGIKSLIAPSSTSHKQPISHSIGDDVDVILAKPKKHNNVIEKNNHQISLEVPHNSSSSQNQYNDMSNIPINTIFCDETTELILPTPIEIKPTSNNLFEQRVPSPKIPIVSISKITKKSLENNINKSKDQVEESHNIKEWKTSGIDQIINEHEKKKELNNAALAKQIDRVGDFTWKPYELNKPKELFIDNIIENIGLKEEKPLAVLPVVDNEEIWKSPRIDNGEMGVKFSMNPTIIDSTAPKKSETTIAEEQSWIDIGVTMDEGDDDNDLDIDPSLIAPVFHHSRTSDKNHSVDHYKVPKFLIPSNEPIYVPPAGHQTFIQPQSDLAEQVTQEKGGPARNLLTTVHDGMVFFFIIFII